MRHALPLLAVLLAGCGSDEAPLPPQDDAARAVEDLAAADAPPAPEDRPVAPVDAAREDAPPVLDAVAVDAFDAGHLADDHPMLDAPPAEVATDAGRCALCSYPNARAECSPSGACSLVGCLPGFGDCDGMNANGCETNTNEAANCGACGNACPSGVRCIDGRCDTCTAGQRWCSGRCVEVNTSDAHCGGCGVACGFAQSCAAGRCACSLGFGDCDGNAANGCEARIDTVESCGACGARCPSGTCTRYFDAGAQGYACAR